MSVFGLELSVEVLILVVKVELPQPTWDTVILLRAVEIADGLFIKVDAVHIGRTGDDVHLLVFQVELFLPVQFFL